MTYLRRCGAAVYALAVFGVFGVVCAFGVGCVGEHAQVDVQIDSDPALLAEATAVRLQIWRGRDGDVIRDTTARFDEGFSLPSVAVVIPADNDAAREFKLRADLLAEGRIIATQRMISSFVAGTRVEETLRFTQACAGECDTLQTCEEGACVSACMQPADERLERYECTAIADPCEALDVEYCDSFETDQSYASRLVLDDTTSFARTDQEFRGSEGHSGHFYAPSDTNYAYLRLTEFSRAPSSRWVRVWFKLPPGELQLSLLTAENPSAAETTAIALYTNGESYTVATAFGYDEPGSSADYPFPDEVQLPQGRWFCLELNLDIESDRTSVFVDGETAVTVDGPIPMALDDVHLGVAFRESIPDADPYDVFVDDIALSTSRVGCDVAR